MFETYFEVENIIFIFFLDDYNIKILEIRINKNIILQKHLEHITNTPKPLMQMEKKKLSLINFIFSTTVFFNCFRSLTE
jgi:hypothetical protein